MDDMPKCNRCGAVFSFQCDYCTQCGAKIDSRVADVETTCSSIEYNLKNENILTAGVDIGVKLANDSENVSLTLLCILYTQMLIFGLSIVFLFINNYTLSNVFGVIYEISFYTGIILQLFVSIIFVIWIYDVHVDLNNYYSDYPIKPYMTLPRVLIPIYSIWGVLNIYMNIVKYWKNKDDKLKNLAVRLENWVAVAIFSVIVRYVLSKIIDEITKDELEMIIRLAILIMIIITYISFTKITLTIRTALEYLKNNAVQIIRKYDKKYDDPIRNRYVLLNMLLITFVLLTVLTTVYIVKAKEVSYIYNHKGVKYYEERKYDRAIVNYNKAIKLKSNSANYYINRAHAYDAKGNKKKAMEDLLNAVKYNPKSEEAYRELGEDYREEYEYDNAMIFINKAIYLNPKSWESYEIRGDIYYDREEYEKAIADFEEAYHINKKVYDVINDCGATHYMLGNYDRAIKYFEIAKKMNPNNALNNVNLGVTYYKKGKYEKAISYYEKAEINDRDDEDIYYHKGNAYLKMGDYDNAIKNYDEAIRIYPYYIGAIYKCGEAYELKGDMATAIVYYKEAVRFDEDGIKRNEAEKRIKALKMKLNKMK